MCKFSFLRCLAGKIITKTKESALTVISVLFGSVPFGSARLHWNHRE